MDPFWDKSYPVTLIVTQEMYDWRDDNIGAWSPHSWGKWFGADYKIYFKKPEHRTAFLLRWQ